MPFSVSETAIVSEFITLGQFLKFVGIAGQGGEPKAILQSERATVNGEPENRRGRKLYPNDVVVFRNKAYRIIRK